MNTPFDKLEQLFEKQKEISREDLFSLFDEAGIPREICWRAIYRIIFDKNINLISELDPAITKTQFEPLLERALDNAQKGAYTEKALLALIKEYSSITFSIYNSQLTGVLDDMDKLTSEFKTMSTQRQKTVKALESETVIAVESDISIDDKIKRIKSKFRKTIQMFQRDIVKLDQMNHTDHLTGLYNRRFFDEQLLTEFFQATTEKTWLNLLMMDIDDFKRFNDRYGHMVGDQALKTIAKNIRDVCEEEMGKTGLFFFPTRYGGEEFTIILPAVDQNDALNIAEKIRTKISNYSFVIRNKEGKIKHKNLSLTVSVGVASLDHGQDRNQGIKMLIKNADTAMYQAKKAGKNCIKTFK